MYIPNLQSNNKYNKNDQYRRINRLTERQYQKVYEIIKHDKREISQFHE